MCLARDRPVCERKVSVCVSFRPRYVDEGTRGLFDAAAVTPVTGKRARRKRIVWVEAPMPRKRFGEFLTRSYAYSKWHLHSNFFVSFFVSLTAWECVEKGQKSAILAKSLSLFDRDLWPRPHPCLCVTLEAHSARSISMVYFSNSANFIEGHSLPSQHIIEFLRSRSNKPN
jgi:hypothetical protein